MKKIVLLPGILVVLASCNSQKFQDQRCYGLLIDSLTKLSKYSDRIQALESGATELAKDYQLKIESLEKTVDSLTAKRPKYSKKSAVAMHKGKKLKDKKAVAKTVVAHNTVAIAKMKERNDDEPRMAPFYYEYANQKYYYYDRERKVYYSIDPVSGEKIYQ